MFLVDIRSSLCMGLLKKLVYFYYYSWIPLYFLVLFINLIVLFQLPFILYFQEKKKKVLIK